MAVHLQSIGPRGLLKRFGPGCGERKLWTLSSIAAGPEISRKSRAALWIRTWARFHHRGPDVSGPGARVSRYRGSPRTSMASHPPTCADQYSSRYRDSVRRGAVAAKVRRCLCWLCCSRASLGVRSEQALCPTGFSAETSPRPHCAGFHDLQAECFLVLPGSRVRRVGAPPRQDP